MLTSIYEGEVVEITDRVLDDLCTVACTEHDAIIYIGNVSAPRLWPHTTPPPPHR